MNGTVKAARVVCMSGSVRKGSFNDSLMRISARMLREKGAEVTVLDLHSHPLPVFSEDLEKEKGNAAASIKEIVNEADGLLIASPEYNGMMTPLLVNTLSWLSRPMDKDEPMYASFRNKMGLLVSASPGGLGGLRGLNHARQLLTNLGTVVLPVQVAIGGSYQAFEGTGDDAVLKVEKQEEMLNTALQQFMGESRSVANRQLHCTLVKKYANEYGEVILPSS